MAPLLQLDSNNTRSFSVLSSAGSARAVRAVSVVLLFWVNAKANTGCIEETIHSQSTRIKSRKVHKIYQCQLLKI
jgi:hypothetical protein